MPDFIDEEDCSLCSRMSPSQRAEFRAELDKLRIGDEPICDACLMAFMRNLGWPVSDTDEPTQH